MAGLSISKAWDETKARLGSDGRLMAIVGAALLLLPQALVSTLTPPEQLSGVAPSGALMLLALVAALVGMVGQIAIIRLALVESTSVGEAIAHGARRFLPAFLAAVLLIIAACIVLIPILLLFGATAALTEGDPSRMSGTVLIAAVLIIALAVLVAPRFLMMMPVATAEQGGPVHILKRSWSLGAGHYFRLLGFMLLVLVAAMVIVFATEFVIGAALKLLFGDLEPMSLGALLYGLLFGAIQAAFGVVMSVMLARIYVQVSGQGALDVSVPKSGT
ncbi:MAG TPA: hypothetical protein VFO51_02305 [Sphingomicrobium sp.]|nr:hypothetical protein [Sphingomicrobium sp.]